MLRSGSTWSFNVCRLMAKAIAGRENRPLWTGYMLPEQSEPLFERYGDAQPGPTVVKAHSLGPRGLELLHAGKAKAVCTYRDPRDCVASMMTFAGRPFDDAVNAISQGLLMLESILRTRHALAIRYEDMLADPAGQIALINQFLGLSLEPAILTRINEMCGLEASRRVCEDLRQRPSKAVLHSTENHRVDPQTWLHDNHIQSGKAGRWKDEMEPWQVQALSQAFDPWLARMGYEPAARSSASATNAA
jgi:hypothetical protein